MLKFLVCCRCRDEETILVSCTKAADDAGTGDGAGNEGDEVGEFGFEDGVEDGGGAEGEEAVGVGEVGEDADFVGVLELGADCHDGVVMGDFAARGYGLSGGVSVWVV